MTAATPHGAAPADTTDRTPEDDRPETATYLFAVCREGDRPVRLPSGCGHTGGGDVRLLHVAGLTAVVQDVPAEKFSEQALTERLSDRAELENYARAHHQVIFSVAQDAATVPLPLATIHRSDERTRAALRDGAARFHTALDRIGHRVEWGVKVYAVPCRSRADEDPPKTGPVSVADPRAKGAGRAYLERVRERTNNCQQQQNAALQAAELTHRSLSERVVAARRLRAHGPDLSGEQDSQLLNAAYLVDRHSHAALPEAVRELRAQPWAQGVRIEVTGPWVPYSFADMGGAGDADPEN